MPYTHAATGETMESTWDRHPSIAGRARVWRRDDKPDDGNWEYPWFYRLPGGTYASIAHTWEEAMAAINEAYTLKWASRMTSVYS